MRNDITQILRKIETGDQHAASELLPLVYQELRKLAAQKMSQDKAGQTLQPTALVHEAFMRLVGNEDQAQWDNRGHFFAAAATAMRRILIEAARRRNSEKRGGKLVKVDLNDDDAIVVAKDDATLLALDVALDRLAAVDPELARLVELRYFTGLTVDETAKAMGVSPRTTKRNWAYARAWLHRELNGDDPNGGDAKGASHE